MPAQHRRSLISPVLALGVGGIGVLAGLMLFIARPPAAVAPTTITSTTVVSSTTAAKAAEITITIPLQTTTTLPSRLEGEVPGWTVGQPWGTTNGLTMFRGNPTRTYYGEGPLPSAPRVLWRYPQQGGLCGSSVVGGESRVWCGTGWTGQPVVWERTDGITEVIFGAYDKAVHFLDAADGSETRPSFPVGDIIKGSVTLDPDGYPLLYFGSRDNKLRVVALDRDPVEEMWSFDASAVRGIWNNDWDGNPVVVDDVLYEGGENGWFFAIKLNRTYRPDGLVAVQPEVIFQERGWTDELLAAVGSNVSIESSVMIHGRTAYFANSGGRVAGFDISRIIEGVAPLVFDFWVGDDTDATLVSDNDGSIYVAVEEERKNARSRELGQLIKLDPTADEPFVWGVPVPGGNADGGLWATPALAHGMIYASTQPGDLLAVDAGTGKVTWEEHIGWHAWSSPVVVGDDLLVGTCTGQLRAYSLADPAAPRLLWSLPLSESCIESTPAVWGGRIYVGSRDGGVYAIGG
jgi:outer membrane protein assembly factor BamB